MGSVDFREVPYAFRAYVMITFIHTIKMREAGCSRSCWCIYCLSLYTALNYRFFLLARVTLDDDR